MPPFTRRVAISALRLLPRNALSRAAGRVVEWRLPPPLLHRLMRLFVRAYDVNVAEMREPLESFATFQQFTAELWSQTEAAHKAGKSVDEAAANTSWIGKYQGYESVRVKAAVQTIYDELSGK